MFLLPWSTGTASEKVLPKDGKTSTGKIRTSPVVHLPFAKASKRRRESDETASQDMGPPAKKRVEQATNGDLQPSGLSNANASQTSSPSIVSDSRSTSGQLAGSEGLSAKSSPLETDGKMSMDTDEKLRHTHETLDIGQYSESRRAETEDGPHPTSLTTLRQTIESQFSLEILLKHRELRLIDQELAKCQVALEQLRRCHIMPYPASTSEPSVMSMVITGTGPAHDGQAEQPPPWGVTDGPYSRHYAKWLLPDSAFGDDASDDLSAQQAGKAPVRVRGGQSQKTYAGATARGQRGSARANLQSLPHGYPQPKENRGPMIIKRSADRRMVKLVCLDCRREDFNSAQGFINHCRIAHKREFATHDAAAVACGEEVEVDDSGGVAGETGGNQVSTGLVHPLIRSGPLTHAKAMLPPGQEDILPKPSGPLRGSYQAPRTPRSDLQDTDLFRPSPQTPHLSALFARSGRGGDLDEMVTEARRRPEPETPFSDDLEDDEQETDEGPEEVEGHHTLGTRGVVLGGSRLPARSGMSPAPTGRPSSSKSTNHTRRKPGHLLHTAMATPPFSTPYHPSATLEGLQSFDHDLGHANDSPADSLPTMNLSPNTIESHPAPSLVSDDGDYDNPHSESETASSTVVSEDEESVDVKVTDHDHHAMDIDEPGGSSNADFSEGKAHPTMPAPRRRAAPETGRRRVRKPRGGSRRKGGK